MSLYLIATPIGNYDDLGHRALNLLRQTSVIITEERKEASKLLRHYQITGKQFEELNEHSNAEDLDKLLKICETQDVALISDCGTPAFCDPGADLVKLCRDRKVTVKSVPGPSSLACFISLLGVRLDQFWFRGFLSAKTELRQKQWKDLTSSKIPVLIMDTPYRLQKTIQECSNYFSQKHCILGMDLSQENELVIAGKPKQILDQMDRKKAEFMLMIFPTTD